VGSLGFLELEVWGETFEVWSGKLDFWSGKLKWEGFN